MTYLTLAMLVSSPTRVPAFESRSVKPFTPRAADGAMTS